MAGNDSSQMWQTMSIASAGESVLRSAPRRAAGAPSGAAGRSTGLFVGDIQGAAPRSKQRNRSGPTDLTLRTDDVVGAAPATLHRTYQNKPDFALNTHDIDGEYSFVAATSARSFAEFVAVISVPGLHFLTILHRRICSKEQLPITASQQSTGA